MLVATAGHIDHGKTSLIRALTGVETDRLPEEKSRGMTIDLGFAFLRPEDDAEIGFIDVPGHERFVRNMLAGVSGIDSALLVVAADDGIMPQTIEHVQILDLFAITRGVVAITKCDRASRARIDEVRDGIAELLAQTTLHDIPVFEVSSITGAGISELAASLRAANRIQPSRSTDGRHFRMAIDRSFSVTGAGTVVTGTVIEGAVEVGARLQLAPRMVEVRVRGLQSGGRSATILRPGERCAVNLTGVKPHDIHRGDWLVTPGMALPSQKIEGWLRILPSEGASLRHNAPVHLHIGTADIEARVLVSPLKSLAPGAEGAVHLVLSRPTHAVTGDRFVLRDQAGRRTLGGGRVLLPEVPGGRYANVNRVPVSDAMRLFDAAGSLAALLAIERHEVDTPRFERAFNLKSSAAQMLYEASGAVRPGGGSLALHGAYVDRVGKSTLEAVRKHHDDHPETQGIGLIALRASIGNPVSAAAWRLVLKDLSLASRLVLHGNLVRLPGHGVQFSSSEAALWYNLLMLLEDKGARPFGLSAAAQDLRAHETLLKVLLVRKRGLGEVWQVTEKLWILREHAAVLADVAARLATSTGPEGFMAAQYRDAIGTGRTLAIEILEFFDRVGVTRRRDLLRTMGQQYPQIFVADE